MFLAKIVLNSPPQQVMTNGRTNLRAEDAGKSPPIVRKVGLKFGNVRTESDVRSSRISRCAGEVSGGRGSHLSLENTLRFHLTQGIKFRSH